MVVAARPRSLGIAEKSVSLRSGNRSDSMLSIAAAGGSSDCRRCRNSRRVSAAAFDLDLDSGGNVAHEACKPQRVRKPPHERPQADSLNGSAHDETLALPIVELDGRSTAPARRPTHRVARSVAESGRDAPCSRVRFQFRSPFPQKVHAPTFARVGLPQRHPDRARKRSAPHSGRVRRTLNSWIVPGGAPDRTASMRIAAVGTFQQVRGESYPADRRRSLRNSAAAPARAFARPPARRHRRRRDCRFR